LDAFSKFYGHGWKTMLLRVRQIEKWNVMGCMIVR